MLLDELIRERKQATQEYATYLKKIIALTKQVAQPGGSAAYPHALNSSAKRALYDNLDQDESLALALDEDIRYTKKDGWRGNKIKSQTTPAPYRAT